MATRERQSKNHMHQRRRGTVAGNADPVLSITDEERQAGQFGAGAPSLGTLDELAGDDVLLTLDGLRAGYGPMEVLHDFSLRVGRAQSLCLIGPNGAGKSTVLHTIFGFTNIYAGSVRIGGSDVTRLKPNDKLKRAGVAYVLQDNSAFPDLTVEENLWMGGYLMDSPKEAKSAAGRIFDKYPQLAQRRALPARVLSGGERRLLEISRALVMDPQVLLIDEPSIGLEPRFIEMIFEIMDGLQHRDGKTILMVEQNAKKGLEFADIGYVLVSGQLARAGKGADLIADPDVGRLFLGQ
ncbi:ABC transporter ATP-binding protein [Chelativorans xinjiangense]|uniref:ABC transporter ATP-binding protein n=1 Tax=Chelativorans xinjiangense TaxID=2681485 RepID=UPI001FE46A1E|nr:ABC transporter ATP-binding protein [Chelativorans xinjiangense]